MGKQIFLNPPLVLSLACNSAQDELLFPESHTVIISLGFCCHSMIPPLKLPPVFFAFFLHLNVSMLMWLYFLTASPQLFPAASYSHLRLVSQATVLFGYFIYNTFLRSSATCFSLSTHCWFYVQNLEAKMTFLHFEIRL